MFIVTKGPLEVWWPVTIEVPADGGTTIEHKISVKFKILEADEFRDLLKNGQTAPGEADVFEVLVGSVGGENDWLPQVVVDWKEVADENEKKLPFDPGLLKKLLQRNYFRAGLEVAYVRCLRGRKEKNSGEPSGTG